MILLLFILFLKATFGFSFKGIDYTTTIYKNSKLYVYEPDDIELNWSGLTIYNLDDGPISDIKSQLVNFTNSNPVYAPQFLQLPQGLSNGRSNELWMIGGIVDDKLKNNSLSKENWSCEIINDSQLKFIDNFIPMPPFKNFAKSGFSQTIVNNSNGPELYIIGGLDYSKELDKDLITNYFYKYEFDTGKWIDLNNATRSILKPRAFHKVVEVDNSLLLIGGIQDDKVINGNFEHKVPANDDADFGGITTIFKFDLKEKKWSTINTKLNKDPNIYKTGKGSGSVYDIYNEKIISYISLYNYVENNYEPQLGVLDYNTWEWEWHNVKDEAGVDNNLFLSYYQTLIINDQLILIHGFLNISGEDSKLEASGISGWTIAIAVLGSILLITLSTAAIWFYFRYKKRDKVDNNNNNKQEMQEIWASAAHETDGLKSRAAPFSNNNIGNIEGFNDSVTIEGSIVNYECFQHEVDFEYLELDKVKA